MAAPLLGLASLLGREYAYTRPTYKEQDDILKVLSPQTYYGNKLINYLTEKLGIDSSLPTAQNTVDTAGRIVYSNPSSGISEEDYNQQMASLSAQTNLPGGQERFEDYLRDLDYGTITPVDSQYVGPLEEYDSLRADDEYAFRNSLSDFQPGLQNDTNDLGEMTIVDQKDSGSSGDLSYTDMIDAQNQTLNSTFNSGMNVPDTATPSMPDYSRAYGALGGAESVNNLRNQLLSMGISEDIIGSAFSAYYAPEVNNEGIKSIVLEAGYRNGGFLNRGGR